MNMFKPSAAKTPQEYLDLIENPRKSEVEFLFNFIKKLVPELKPNILASMIGFGTYHYKYASGREGDWSLIALASQKNYISVYVCAAVGKEYLAEKYKDKLGKVNVGRSCIRFKKVEDVNLPVLKQVILEAKKIGGMGQS